MNTKEPSRKKRRYEREHRRILLMKRTTSSNPWIVGCACGWETAAHTQERAKHAYTKHKASGANPRRINHHPATPVKNAPELPKGPIYKRPERYPIVAKCMYCDAGLTYGECASNRSRPPRRSYRKRRRQSPRSGTVCKDKTQCRRNRRAGGVGKYFKKPEPEEDEG